jgi:glycosyltransferase involved in cell wall biosynthesis
MKVALVHDYLNQQGGAEKVLMNLAELFPNAPVYTLLYSPKAMGPEFGSMDIRTSILQKLPFAEKHYEKYLPFYPLFIEQFDLRGYDLVISDSSAWAKGALTFPPTCHVSYFHTPMRFAWDQRHIVSSKRGAATRTILDLTMNYLRLWDVVSTERVDFIACNSNEVSKRVRKYYNRRSTVIHPPVDTEYYTPSDNGFLRNKAIKTKYPDG